MIDSKADCSEAETSRRWMQRGILAALCSLVIGIYACTARSEYLPPLSLNAADDYYNLLVRGFRAGQLSLYKKAPDGLTQLADPYDPLANARYRVESDRLHDLSYYKGKLYLYYGVTPALLLFWPYAALTGHYLLEKNVVVMFCLVAFLVDVALLHALWRRYFSVVSIWVLAAGTLTLGLATAVPVMLPRSVYNEVSISCGFALTMLAMAAVWKALHETEQRCWWLAVASLAYGLAVGARPDLLFGAVILLVPVVHAWRERRHFWTLLIVAIGPIALIGIALMLYNFLRFDNPFDFGWHYVLAGAPLLNRQLFSTRYLGFNFRANFLEPARWSAHFPFVHQAAVPRLPAGYDTFEDPYGVLTNVPVVWLALAVPLGWRNRAGQARSVLWWFAIAATLLLGICALAVCLYSSTTIRFRVDFLPVWVLLATMGVLSVERALADRRVWLRTARLGWGLLLGFSVAFNLLASVGRCAEWHCLTGFTLARRGNVPEAVGHYEQALQLNPDYAEAHYNLGAALTRQGRLQEAIGQFEQALRLNPDYAEAHNNLGAALMGQGKLQEAIGHYEQALRLSPGYADAHNNLGAALMGQGRLPEAIGHYEQALRLNPDYADAHYNFGSALVRLGRQQQAIGHWEEALRINPDFVEAHYNLGVTLEQAGHAQEAVAHYEQALRVKPDFVQAQNALERARAAQ
jgi:tetratricopeptide (TPR) repeat protein